MPPRSASVHETKNDGVDGDDVAILEQTDRTALLGFRANMPDAETAGRSGETPIGDERDFVAHALAVWAKQCSKSIFKSDL